MGITELVEVVRAGLDEDHKLAFEAGNGGTDTWIFDPELTWNSDAGPREAVVRFNGSALSYVAAVDPVHGKYGTWNARHIARHDPQRVLAEVAAKRRLLDQALAWEHYEVDDPWYCCPASKAYRNVAPAPYPCDCGRDERVLGVLQALAAPYQETT